MPDNSQKVIHTSVLLQSAIEGLNLGKGNLSKDEGLDSARGQKETVVFVDATLGSGGHSQYAYENLGQKLNIMGIDMSRLALERATERLVHAGMQKSAICTYNGNFKDIDLALSTCGQKKANAILLDLGWSTEQLEGRGMSFQNNEPLDMRLADTEDNTITAQEIVNHWAEETLADIFYGYGEERFARRIARAIVERRQIAPIVTTFDLVSVIEHAVPFYYKRSKIHFATRTFQALRIAVNNELENLKIVLAKSMDLLESGGRIAVISFHSLEDRIVKRFFKQQTESGLARLITKKPIVADERERKYNPRSRSAKLRILEKIKINI